jgi:hypothetical protein
MDTGKLNDNTTFYDGYEGETEIMISLVDDPKIVLHVWDGYFEDIFGKPLASDDGWHGFTSDYQELRNAFAEDGESVSVEPDCYLNDLYLYRGHHFSYEETSSCLELLITFFEYARDIQSKVCVSVL